MFMRRAAGEAQVLLKNENGLLPIAKGPKSIAVFGQNASLAVAMGGGSASLKSAYVISPLEAITRAAQEIGAQVEHAVGAKINLYLPLATPLLTAKEANTSVGTLEFWLPPNNPGTGWLTDIANIDARTAPDHSSAQNDAFIMLLNDEYAPMAVPDQCSRVSQPFSCRVSDLA